MRDPILKTPLVTGGLRTFIAVMALAASSTSVNAGGASAEDSVKAAFVYNFAKLTTWPGGSGNLVIGVIGSSGAGDAIKTVVDGKDANGRKIDVKSIGAGDAKSCQMVFVCGSGKAPSAGSGVLTVGEGPGFASSGGGIGFVTDGGKVRFEINVGAIKKAGLSVSDKLTAIGKVVG